ncbi:50S ribosomal protein L23 [Candidatus Woesebacteria bacterium GWC2_33_12]|uniref:50S ribosomal protein L23 n=1 Tax=Candidatus Woesebacteria bacterium GW2011_GWB1_33_22 TaxID=1618566 RepID=A0A0G0A139_9BACT|nr:MAG: 50S ribosomal protein L23 [Candidatus Woesebacteria bacterium GW2011_GWC2_33_12]KKP42187.1 MAG: 50S ribosomal protein L23 [Candidatus Woesebacteria bacterium GW2011_GWA2_33_20]KKP44921.1 MAG: 50S ribosomal protein L23 [Candidatus Woesebacteria bacterium GW2011_GWB1_33_22]KKP46735.1 MAG: 50S ribosomal protein L23 [Microgenomates group bacterium GW2011_GWC1_33_28]KKP50635.1 MAG: 50S ribosomal protein L23 [Candidatus Woesebacteria bacterium GW2011_GWA1_33_33]OGM07779.1 MAG: 50S ribosomal 
MKIRPIFTEKSMNQAKSGNYSFWVLPTLTKNQIKSLFEKAYDVKVRLVKTINYKKSSNKNARGRVVTKKAMKKAIISLKSGKIDIFTETKK